MDNRKHLDIIIGVIAIVFVFVIIGVWVYRVSDSKKSTETSSGQITETVTGTGTEPSGETEEAGRTAAETQTEEETVSEESTPETESAESSETETESETDPEGADDTAEIVSTPLTPKERGRCLTELAHYMEENDRKAADDLIRLDRYLALSKELSDGSYYYYGDEDTEGRPEGKGVAVYQDNQYYYGSWSAGARSGDGVWMKLYRYTETDAEKDQSYVSHSYSGEWMNDLPNGKGQEQYVLEVSKMKDDAGYNQNVIGTFKDGLYHGDMYLIKQYLNGNTKEWRGSAQYGVWQVIGKMNQTGEYPVCMDVSDEENYLWYTPVDNVNIGIEGIIATGERKE